MIFNLSHDRTIIIEWPRGRMAWFFWRWKPNVLQGWKGYRIGPLTYVRYV